MIRHDNTIIISYVNMPYNKNNNYHFNFLSLSWFVSFPFDKALSWLPLLLCSCSIFWWCVTIKWVHKLLITILCLNYQMLQILIVFNNPNHTHNGKDTPTQQQKLIIILFITFKYISHTLNLIQIIWYGTKYKVVKRQKNTTMISYDHKSMEILHKR